MIAKHALVSPAPLRAPVPLGRRQRDREPSHTTAPRLASLFASGGILQGANTVPDLDGVMMAVAGGDRRAFASLFDAVAGAVYGVVIRVLRAPAHAEEVVQEVMLEVWQKAPSWSGDRGSAAAWILTIARRRAIDRVRSEQAARDRAARVAPGWHEPDVDGVPDGVITSAEHDVVRGLLGALSEVQREVIELAFYDGHTQQEIAGKLEVPLGTVKTRMRDGLLKLRASAKGVIDG